MLQRGLLHSHQICSSIQQILLSSHLIRYLPYLVIQLDLVLSLYGTALLLPQWLCFLPEHSICSPWVQHNRFFDSICDIQGYGLTVHMPHTPLALHAYIGFSCNICNSGLIISLVIMAAGHVYL